MGRRNARRTKVKGLYKNSYKNITVGIIDADSDVWAASFLMNPTALLVGSSRREKNWNKKRARN